MTDVRELVVEKIDKKDIEHIPRAFEIVGDIAIVELDKVAKKYAEVLAQAIMQLNKNVRVVLNKTEDVSGKFRVPKYEVIMAKEEERDFSHIKKEFRPKKITETVHTESGCRYLLDLAKVYFSSKLGFERSRITSQVKDNEHILVMFAGVGPFAINIAKKRNVSVVAIELNPHAVEYFRKNLVLNKVEHKIKIIEGDVAEVLPKMKEKFDRVVMPAPKDARDFLELALEKVKNNGMVHLYTFASHEEIESKEVVRKIEQRCKEHGTDAKVVFFRKCGAVGPYHYRVVLDIKLEGKEG